MEFFSVDAKGRHAGEPAGARVGEDCYILRNTSHRPPHSPPTNIKMLPPIQDLNQSRKKMEDRESLTHSISFKSEIGFFFFAYIWLKFVFFGIRKNRSSGEAKSLQKMECYIFLHVWVHGWEVCFGHIKMMPFWNHRWINLQKLVITEWKSLSLRITEG